MGFPTVELLGKTPYQDFVELPSEEEMVPFIKELGLDRLRPSRAQILWGMFYKENVDFVALLWEDFIFQADNRDISLARKENMPYPRFTKVIINHFISKDKTISIRNRINLHIIRDDSLLIINQAIKDSKAYKIYLAFATGKATSKKARKFKKIASPSKKQTLVLEDEPAKKPKRDKHPEPAKKSTSAKEDASATSDRSKGIDLLSEAALLEDAQMKKVLKRSKKETYSRQESGLGDGVGSQPKFPDELQDKTTNTDEGTDDDDSNDDDVSDDNGNEDDSDDNGGDDDSDDERTESDEDENHNLNQKDDDIQEEYEDEYECTPSSYESTENVVWAKYSSQPQSTYDGAKEHKELYDGMVKSYKLDNDLFESYEKAYSLKKGREDKDKDEDPPAGLDQGLKRRKISKDPKSSGKSNQAEESVFEVAGTEMPKNQGSDLEAVWNSSTIKEYYKAVTDRLDWNNPKGKKYPFDLSKPLLLIMDRGHQVIPVDYFINNDLEYLRGGSSSKKYTTFVTKKRLLSMIFHALKTWFHRYGVRSDISNKTPYTAYNNHQGIIYEDKYKRNKLMRTDELYKFSYGTLTSIRYVLCDIASNMRMDYLPKRRWISLDRKRSRIMIKAINK
nr:hypothetical protein [Tanacetum cinerariifolium]